MTYDELNNYILDYLENDKTNSAIMLSGGWGTGKSYYIKNTLKPFMKDHDKECVIISLYGLQDIAEISKAIYIELRLKKASEAINHEAIKTTWVALKTVAKGVSSFFGVDLSQDDNSLQSLYESINLSGKLLVFEDVERASIDVIELLGYINNLVEQGDVKALLVCNENEIAKKVKIEKEPDENSKNNKKEYILDYTEKAKEYLAYKEKTIVDTLVFEPDIKATLLSIIDDFDNENLSKYKTDSFCQDVNTIFHWEKSVNFRTFIFATQKFLDILKHIDTSKYPDDFITKIYYSIIAFSIRYKENRNIKWDGNSNYSLDLGMNVCPIYKDCFDYIVNQVSSFSHFDEYYIDYLEIFNHQDIIRTFENYYLLPEKEVTKSLKDLEVKLSKNEVSIGIYPKLLLHLVTLEKNIESDISNIVEFMIQNVKGQSNKLGGEHAFYFATSINDKDMLLRYHEIADSILASADDTACINCDFSYNVENVSDDCSRIGSLYSFELKNKSFMERIDVVKLADLIINCSSEQIVNIRTLFQSIYETSTPEYNKVEETEGLKELLKELYDSDKSKLDKIQKLNIYYFEKDIESYTNDLLEEQ